MRDVGAEMMNENEIINILDHGTKQE